MDKQRFHEEQVNLEDRMTDVVHSRAPLHHLRAKIVAYFTHERIGNMAIPDYALGYKRRDKGFNFCYAIERQLDGLGSMLGSPASKFGIYFSPKHERVMVSKGWGATEQVAFPAIKHAIVDLIDAGDRDDTKAIANSDLSEMFKGKILATYYPDKYLHVFSNDHLNYFLKVFNLDAAPLSRADAIYKKQALAEYKNADPVMRLWTIDMFSHFLYEFYPGWPPKKIKRPTGDPLANYRLPDFPDDPIASFVGMNIMPPAVVQPGNRTRGSANPDYEAEARKHKQWGDRGEKIVKDLEKERLMKAGKTDLAARVKPAACDGEGYDILSFEEDSTERYIEVKTTSANVGKVNFFLSANELRKAKELFNYQVYVVFEILTSRPKVWILGNPFHPENEHLIKTPVSYRVTIQAMEE